MKGRETEYDRWYEAYVDEMFSYGMAFGIEKDVVLDIIHDIFLYLYEKEDKQQIENVKFYLLRSLKNRILSMKRQDISFLSVENDGDYEFLIQVGGLDLVDDDEERKEYADQIDYLLSLLTGKQREVIYLHFMQELSYDEIAQILQITTKSVRKLTYRAIERMQEEKQLLGLIFILNFKLVDIVLNELRQSRKTHIHCSSLQI